MDPSIAAATRGSISDPNHPGAGPLGEARRSRRRSSSSRDALSAPAGDEPAGRHLERQLRHDSAKAGSSRRSARERRARAARRTFPRGARAPRRLRPPRGTSHPRPRGRAARGFSRHILRISSLGPRPSRVSDGSTRRPHLDAWPTLRPLPGGAFVGEWARGSEPVRPEAEPAPSSASRRVDVRPTRPFTRWLSAPAARPPPPG